METRRIERELTLSNYNLKCIIREPSKSSDYDYDLNRPERRFISTYVHELKIYDSIMKNEIVSLHFSTDTCDEIILALKNAIYGTKKVLLTSIRNIYVDGILHPKIMAIHKFDIGQIIQISILGNFADPINITFSFDQINSVIELLEYDQFIDILNGEK